MLLELGKRVRIKTETMYVRVQTTSLPFNKYAWLTTHNSFAILGSAPQAGAPILTFFNQEDSVLQQLNVCHLHRFLLIIVFVVSICLLYLIKLVAFKLTC